MSEQKMIFVLLVAALALTLALYLWKTKKTIEYRNDERWHLILLKAANIGNAANWLLIAALAAGATVSVFSEREIMFSLTRVTVFGELFIGMRNAFELIGAIYYDKTM